MLLIDYLNTRIQERHQNGTWRSLHRPKGVIDFCSNDYRGWANSGKIDKKINDFKLAVSGNYYGSTGSRLISGNLPEIEELERQIASVHKAESALLFSSGYVANIGLFSALGSRNVSFVCDELVHASILDGIRLGMPASCWKFKHNDGAHLEALLKKTKGHAIVVVESIYSMDGDESPLHEFLDICQKYNAALITDEAHAIGIAGINELGLGQKESAHPALFARVMTYGKAMGSHGAAVVGSSTLMDFLINHARSFIYSTAPNRSQVFGIRAAYDLLQEDKSSIVVLKRNIEHFQTVAKRLGLASIQTSNSPIQIIGVTGNESANMLANKLVHTGCDVKAILSPTVAFGKERIRVCLHAFNELQEIDELLECVWQHENLNA